MKNIRTFNGDIFKLDHPLPKIEFWTQNDPKKKKLGEFTVDCQRKSILVMT